MKIKEIRKITLVPPCDVACPGKPIIEEFSGLKAQVNYFHIMRIEKIYLINDVAYAYCPEHDILFCVDGEKPDIAYYGVNAK